MVKAMAAASNSNRKHKIQVPFLTERLYLETDYRNTELGTFQLITEKLTQVLPPNVHFDYFSI